MKHLLLLFLVLAPVMISRAQTLTPDLQDLEKWHLFNRKAEPINENGKKGIRLSEGPGDGGLILREMEFSEGTIELDIKGKKE